MRRCTARPYEGEKAYIFVSYCHKDYAQVYPIVERLARDGYLVWYDEGIDPGSEWPEIIARHLNNSAVCIAFITENALNSHNCRREINFALLKKKPFLSVILEPVAMSLGMEMQLSATQAIFKYTLPDEKEFYEKLYSAQLLIPCFDMPNPSIAISKPEDYEVDAVSLFAEAGLKRESFSDKWFVEADQDSAAVPKEQISPSLGEKNSFETEKPEATPEALDAVQERLVEEPIPSLGVPEEGPETAEPQSAVPWLVRVKNGEEIPLPAGAFKLGRSMSNSYVISGNSMVGRWHAMIMVQDGRCALVDNHSMNRTFLNQQALEPGKEYPLRDGDSIRIANEKFVFYFRQMVKVEPLKDQ